MPPMENILPDNRIIAKVIDHIRKQMTRNETQEEQQIILEIIDQFLKYCKINIFKYFQK